MTITDLEGNPLLNGVSDHTEVLAALKNEGTIKSTNEYILDEDMPGIYIVTDGRSEVAIVYD